MSSTLYIRHLCADILPSEREDLLKSFGAERVWFINERSHTAFASFSNITTATEALYRLHQMEVMGRRLVVEYAHQKPSQLTHQNSNETLKLQAIQSFVAELNAINPYIDLYQPFPPNLRYKYPSATPDILFNILYALANHLDLYVQTLHLMNKLGLDPPFGEVNDTVKTYTKKCLLHSKIITDNIFNDISSQISSTEESEISCEEDPHPQPFVNNIKRPKRKSTIKTTNRFKIHALPKTNKRPIDKKEVFEEQTIPKTKKIEINVTNISSTESLINENIVVGEIGKMIPPERNNSDSDANQSESTETNDIITTEELLGNRLSSEDMKILPVFKNYEPGVPSMRLYIKNLAKIVTSDDIKRIYMRYISKDNNEELNAFDVRVMQEGRMKGQGFVTLPDLETSRKALEETNGFILKDKPMVVQFARTANK